MLVLAAPCVVLGELPGMLWRASSTLVCSPLGLSAGACWELIFSLFFPRVLKPNESQLATFAVMGLWTSAKNRFKNIILFTMKDEASEITGQLLKTESTTLCASI